uniref:Histone-lysine N-methyltransferase SETMAR-like n=1 Tax=Hirondellea gigas TaxID=1518452 RepID=A0A2P2HWH6_9CRUS
MQDRADDHVENGVILLPEVLLSFTAKEQRVIARYLHHMKTTSADIHKLLVSVCGEAAAPYKLVKDWVWDDSVGLEDDEEANKNAVSTATNGAISPKQILPTDPALVYRMEYLVNKDRRINMDRASDMCMVTKQTAQHVLCDVLGLKKVCERWVPRLWTPEQRAFRVGITDELLQRYEDEGETFLNRIIVGDETLVYYFTPNVIRRTSKGIIHVGEKYKPSIEQVRIYFMLFYDVFGLLLAEPIPNNADIPSNKYATMLRENLTEAYSRKRRGRKLSNCLLLHDNTAPHISKVTQTAMKDIGMENLPHPPASPDLEPHEYWLIPYLRQCMKGAVHTERHGVTTALNHHIKNIKEEEYMKSINRLPARWETCKDTYGLYVLS